MYRMRKTFLILMIIPFLGCQTNTNMKDYQKKVIKNYIQSYNRFDIDGMTKDLHKGVIFENQTNGKVDLKTIGIENFKKQAQTAKQYFKKREQNITSWNFQEENVIIDIDFKGILAMDTPNGMNEDNTLKLKGQSEFNFKEGKILTIKDKS